MEMLWICLIIINACTQGNKHDNIKIFYNVHLLILACNYGYGEHNCKQIEYLRC